MKTGSDIRLEPPVARKAVATGASATGAMTRDMIQPQSGTRHV